MRRLKVTLEYDGAPFHGSQKQHGLQTVQGCFESAFKEMTGEEIQMQFSGRTDKGVHALGQIAHFDTEIDAEKFPLIRIKDGINRLTPNEMAITKVEVVTEDFQARFFATSREYKFLIFNRRTNSPIWHNRAVHVLKPLDVELMKTACNDLLGEQNFEAFRSVDCQAKTPWCFIEFANITAEDYADGQLITFHIKGNRFLHNMVRIITGTLVAIGQGTKQSDTIANMIQTGERRLGGDTLRPHGLYFMNVEYPEHTVLESC